MAKTVPLSKFAEELKAYSEKNIAEYRKSVIMALTDAIPRLVQKSPVDTGLYAQSWNLDVSEQSAILGNYSPHAPIIEFGARPFTPPLAPLLAWAKRVLKKAEVDDDCWALAKYTQMKIADNGMMPKFILTNEIEFIMNDIRDNLKNGMVK